MTDPTACPRWLSQKIGSARAKLAWDAMLSHGSIERRYKKTHDGGLFPQLTEHDTRRVLVIPVEDWHPE